MRRVSLVTVGLAVAATVLPSGAAALSPTRHSVGGAARIAAQGFVSRYVRGGRVVRTDQGNDTVSAGQAQAMLASAALGDRSTFARVWSWTQHNLELSSGLLASRWKGGRIVNPQPASDADLDAARALLAASQRFRVGAYRRAALRIADAVLANETVMRGGVLVLVAGPWARGRGIVDPGYWAPRTLAQLAAATGDGRFARLERGAIRLAAALTATAPHLPSDWAAVSAGGSIHAIAAPPGHQPAPPQYSLDAARVPIRFAESCSASTHRIAAALWPFFAGQSADRVGAAYTLAGAVTNRAQTTVTLVGAAASAAVAGQSQAATAYLAQAQAINNRFPTYFGSAWLAVGEIELTSSALGGCG